MDVGVEEDTEMGEEANEYLQLLKRPKVEPPEQKKPIVTEKDQGRST